MITSLRTKLIIILLVAVLPAIGVVGWLLGDALATGRRSVEHDFFNQVGSAASVIGERASGSFRVAQAIAADTDILDAGQAACEARLDRSLSHIGEYSGLLILEGETVVCSAQSGIRTLGKDAVALAQANKGTGPAYGWDKTPTGDDLLWVAARWSRDENRSVVILLNADYVRQPMQRLPARLGAKVEFARLNGDPLFAPGLTSAIRELLVSGVSVGELRGAGTGEAGTEIVSIQRLGPLNLAVIAERPRPTLLKSLDRQVVLAVAAPIFLMIAALATLWFGLDRLVLRYLKRFQRVVRDYAVGDTSQRCGAMPGAPAEITQFAGAFDAMADRIAQRTEDLQAQIVEKRHYIRELHHRVKNNLQVITSLLALHRRNLPEAQRGVIRFAEDRVNAMSAAYRTAYAQSETGNIDVGLVIAEVVARLQMGVTGGSLKLDLDIATAGATVDLDAAVALSMLLAELAPPRLDRAAIDGVSIVVSARLEDRTLVLQMPAATQAHDTDALSRRFIEAYLRQLSATVAQVGGAIVVRTTVINSASDAEQKAVPQVCLTARIQGGMQP